MIQMYLKVAWHLPDDMVYTVYNNRMSTGSSLTTVDAFDCLSNKWLLSNTIASMTHRRVGPLICIAPPLPSTTSSKNIAAAAARSS
jgi:hypothetical protein